MTWTDLLLPFTVWLPIGILLGLLSLSLSPFATVLMQRFSRSVPWQIYCLAAIFFAGFAFNSAGNWSSAFIFAALAILQLVCSGLAAWRDLGRPVRVPAAMETEDRRG